MAYNYYNPNPNGSHLGDCVVRALMMALNETWDRAFLKLTVYAFNMKDMPSSNAVWQTLLQDNCFKKHLLPSQYLTPYTVKNFCQDFPQGLYILATGSHVVAVKDGTYYDSWDSGDEVITYFFTQQPEC